MNSKTQTLQTVPANAGRFRRILFRLLGPAVSKTVVCRLLRRKIYMGAAELPAGRTRCSEFLFILPADRIEMIFQLENLFAILGRYKSSNLTFLCPTAHTSFVSALKNVRVVKFNPDDFELYSTEFMRVTAELAPKSFDICVVLEKKHSLAHLYIAGMSRSHLRVGWGCDKSAPFLNIRFVPEAQNGVTLWERNLEAAKILDADADTTVRWGVQKSTAEEVAELLKEHKLKKDPALICVDAASLESGCGKEWCAELLRSVKGAIPGNIYVFGGLEGENIAVKDAPFPVLPPMTIPKAAALMACTDIVITGVGALLGLAQISAAKIVPVLTKEQAALYCRKSGKIAPVIFAEKPAADDIRAVQKNSKALMTASA